MTKNVKLRAAAKDGIVFVHTDGMQPMAKQARKQLKKLGVSKVSLCPLELKQFESGEVKPKILGNVREGRVYLFYDFRPGSPNEDLVNLFLTLDALHLADACDVTLISPYLPYLRQDRKDESRTPISAATIIRLLQKTQSLKRVVTIDMHADQLQAVFEIPTDHLPGRIVMAPWIKKRFKGKFDDVVLVAPDFGSAKRVRKLANLIDPNLGVAILEKSRDTTGVEILSTIGADVNGKVCLINDDMMDTCGTIIKAATALYEQGAQQIILTATHPIFSPSKDTDGKTTTAYEKLACAKVEVVVTDSRSTETHDWLTVLPLAKYMAYTILQHVTKNGSVSRLIEEGVEL